MNKLQDHLANEEFTPQEVWAGWFLGIVIPAIVLLVALVEMGMGWGWGYSIMALAAVAGVGLADLKEAAQEQYLERKQIFRQKEALAKVDKELNEPD